MQQFVNMAQECIEKIVREIKNRYIEKDIYPKYKIRFPHII